MAEEEEKKGEDKGDHINLKVKDQVRAAGDGTRADRQKTRAIKKPAHLFEIWTLRRRVPLSQDNSEVHFKVRQTTKFEKVRSAPDPPLATSWATLPAPPRAVRFLQTYFLVPAVFSRAEPLALPPPRRSSRLSAPASRSSRVPCVSSSMDSASSPPRPPRM